MKNLSSVLSKLNAVRRNVVSAHVDGSRNVSFDRLASGIYVVHSGQDVEGIQNVPFDGLIFTAKKDGSSISTSSSAFKDVSGVDEQDRNRKVMVSLSITESDGVLVSLSFTARFGVKDNLYGRYAPNDVFSVISSTLYSFHNSIPFTSIRSCFDAVVNFDQDGKIIFGSDYTRPENRLTSEQARVKMSLPSARLDILATMSAILTEPISFDGLKPSLRFESV